MVDDNNNSFLKSAAVAAPLGIGVGVGIRNILRETSFSQRPSAVENMRTVAAQVKTSQVDISSHLRFMNNQFAGGKNANIAVAAWQAAIDRVDPVTRRQLRDFTSQIDTMSDTDAINAITNTMRNNQSMLMRNLYSKFRRNVESLTAQHALYPDLPIGFVTPTVDEIPYSPSVLPEHLRSRLTNIASELGATVAPKTPFRKLGDYGVYKVDLAGLPGGDLSFDLPITHQGLMVEGMTMQTQRIAPSIAIMSGGKEVERLTREEFFLRELEKSIVPDIKSGRLSGRAQIQEAVNELENKMFRELEAAAFIDPQEKTAAQLLREDIRSNMLQLVEERTRKTEGRTGYVPSYQPLQGLDYQQALLRNNFYGGISPTAIAKGIVSTEDISKYSLTPEVVNWGRRPEAGFREYQLTEESIDRLKELQGRRFHKYQMLQSDEYLSKLVAYRSGNPINPVMATTYINPEIHSDLLKRLNMRDGHAVMTEEGLRALEFETSHPFKLKAVSQDLEVMLDKGDFTVNRGEVLGVDAAGNVITAEDDMTIQMMRNKSKAEGDFITVLNKQKWQARHGDKFHEMLKATMLQANNDQLRSIQRAANTDRFVKDTQVFASMEVLKKNRQLYRNQIITSLGANLAGDKHIRNLKRMAAAASREAGLNDVDFTRKMMQYALATDFSPEQFGETFATTSYVLGKEGEALINQVLSETSINYQGEYRAAAAGGFARGGARLAFDAPPGMLGAGRALGSVEPRVFEDFRQSFWGPLGGDLAEEFTERLIATDPDKLAVHQGLGRTLKSLTQNITTPRDANVFEAATYQSPIQFQEWLENVGTEGGWIRQGQGLNDVYVPSPSVVNKMRRYTTPAGQTTTNTLTDIYENIARNASEMYFDPGTGQLSVEQARRNLQQYQNQLAYHWAPGGKGMGGYLRGRIAGSGYLRTVAAGTRGQAIDDLTVARIHPQKFQDIMQELVEQQGDNEGLARMREEFNAGRRVGAVIQRHPDIGPFSTQQILIERATDIPDDEIILPEKTINIGGRSITVGPTVGLAADYDADQASLFLVSPRNEERIRKNLMQADSEYKAAYAQHQLRYQLLKPDVATAAEGMSIRQMMAADVQKLGTTEIWVPQLSLEMTRAKTALGQFGRGAGAADARMLLEWLEQNPIGAKHLSAEDVAKGELENLMNRIQYSLRNRDVTGLKSVIDQMVSKDDVAKRFLYENINITAQEAREASRVMGTTIGTTIAAPQVDRAISEMMRSLGEFRSSGAEEEFQLLSGRARRPKTDVISSVLRSTKGTFSTVATAAQTASNIAGSLGRAIIKNKKPIGWGFAGALAISSFLSSPRETIGPGNRLNIGLKPNLSPGKGADRMSPENIMPPSPPIGQPTVPNMLHQNSARIGSNTPSHRVHMKANVGSGTNATQMAQQVANMTNRSTSINIRDDRQSLNPHRIANKM